jgi:hypothetical protein
MSLDTLDSDKFINLISKNKDNNLNNYSDVQDTEQLISLLKDKFLLQSKKKNNSPSKNNNCKINNNIGDIDLTINSKIYKFPDISETELKSKLNKDKLNDTSSNSINSALLNSNSQTSENFASQIQKQDKITDLIKSKNPKQIQNDSDLDKTSSNEIDTDLVKSDLITSDNELGNIEEKKNIKIDSLPKQVDEKIKNRGDTIKEKLSEEPVQKVEQKNLNQSEPKIIIQQIKETQEKPKETQEKPKETQEKPKETQEKPNENLEIKKELPEAIVKLISNFEKKEKASGIKDKTTVLNDVKSKDDIKSEDDKKSSKKNIFLKNNYNSIIKKLENLTTSDADTKLMIHAIKKIHKDLKKNKKEKKLIGGYNKKQKIMGQRLLNDDSEIFYNNTKKLSNNDYNIFYNSDFEYGDNSDKNELKRMMMRQKETLHQEVLEMIMGMLNKGLLLQSNKPIKADERNARLIKAFIYRIVSEKNPEMGGMDKILSIKTMNEDEIIKLIKKMPDLDELEENIKKHIEEKNKMKKNNVSEESEESEEIKNKKSSKKSSAKKTSAKKTKTASKKSKK